MSVSRGPWIFGARPHGKFENISGRSGPLETVKRCYVAFASSSSFLLFIPRLHVDDVVTLQGYRHGSLFPPCSPSQSSSLPCSFLFQSSTSEVLPRYLRPSPSSFILSGRVGEGGPIHRTWGPSPFTDYSDSFFKCNDPHSIFPLFSTFRTNSNVAFLLHSVSTLISNNTN